MYVHTHILNILGKVWDMTCSNTLDLLLPNGKDILNIGSPNYNISGDHYDDCPQEWFKSFLLQWHWVMAFLRMIRIGDDAELHLLRLQSLCSRSTVISGMHFCSRMRVKWSWPLTWPPTLFWLTFGLYPCHLTATWLAALNTIAQVANSASCMPLSPSWVVPVLPVLPLFFIQNWAYM